MSLQIVIDRMPKLCEQVTAATWAYDFRDFYGLRNFSLSDESGKMTAWANSVWVLLNTVTQRPVRIDQASIDLYEPENPLDMEYASRKVAMPSGGIGQEGFVIGKHHLDTNHHVNNAQYVRMAAEYLPSGARVRYMRAEYRKQAKLGDAIHPVVCQGEDENRITVGLLDEAKKPYAVAQFGIERVYA